MSQLHYFNVNFAGTMPNFLAFVFVFDLTSAKLQKKKTNKQKQTKQQQQQQNKQTNKKQRKKQKQTQKTKQNKKLALTRHSFFFLEMIRAYTTSPFSVLHYLGILGYIGMAY